MTLQSAFLNVCHEAAGTVSRNVIPVLQDTLKAIYAGDVTKAREIAHAHPDAADLLREAEVKAS